jgi:NADH-quinone oxidoreductase subunit N
MNASLMGLEVGVLVMALGVLLMDLWLPAERKRQLGYVAAAGVGLILAYTFLKPPPTLFLLVTPVASTNAPGLGPTNTLTPPTGGGAANTNQPAGIPVAMAWGTPNFHGSYVMDGLAVFFKRFFLLTALIVLVMAAEFAGRIETGISEFYSLVLFALSGMMFAASANDFSMLFVSIELITVTFYFDQFPAQPAPVAGGRREVSHSRRNGLGVHGLRHCAGLRNRGHDELC